MGDAKDTQIFCAHSDAEPDARHVTGEFTFSRNDGLSFTCHSIEPDFELTELALLALQEHIAQQLRDKEKCPFHRAVKAEAA